MSQNYKDFAIYLDLDGVLADYSAGLVKMGFPHDPALNRPSHLLPGSGNEQKRIRYEAVKGTTFYADLPMMAGAEKLYNEVFHAHPIILTAAPKFGAGEEDYHVNPHWLGAAYHKRGWVERVLLPAAANDRQSVWGKLFSATVDRYHIPDERFICTTSARKHNFMHRKHAANQVLVDDRPDNIDPWIAAGGIGILHTSVEDSIKQLRKLL